MLMDNLIRVHTDKKGMNLSRKTVQLIRGAAEAALMCEGMNMPCEIDVTLTDDAGIREINARERKIDSATDVLSFPALNYRDGKGEPEDTDFDPDSGRLFLGDIVISIERARAQAEEYGHGLARECGFLTVHSVMHLLGYDHVDTEERRVLMREHEEQVLTLLGLERTQMQEDFPELAKYLRAQSAQTERD